MRDFSDAAVSVAVSLFAAQTSSVEDISKVARAACLTCRLRLLHRRSAQCCSCVAHAAFMTALCGCRVLLRWSRLTAQAAGVVMCMPRSCGRMHPTLQRVAAGAVGLRHSQCHFDV